MMGWVVGSGEGGGHGVAWLLFSGAPASSRDLARIIFIWLATISLEDRRESTSRHPFVLLILDAAASISSTVSHLGPHFLTTRCRHRHCSAIAAASAFQPSLVVAARQPRRRRPPTSSSVAATTASLSSPEKRARSRASAKRSPARKRSNSFRRSRPGRRPRVHAVAKSMT